MISPTYSRNPAMLAFFKKKPESEKSLAGKWGEKVAARMLRRQGYRILGCRVRVGRHDEFDIVAKKMNTLVFVEVKTRKNEQFGRPASTVSRRQKHALSRAAVHYLKRLRSRPDYIRFDIVEVVGQMGERDPVVRHIENAFPMDRRYNLQW